MKHQKAIAAITGIVIIETIALLIGMDGALFGIAIAAIAGLGGFVIAQSRKG